MGHLETKKGAHEKRGRRKEKGWQWAGVCEVTIGKMRDILVKIANIPFSRNNHYKVSCKKDNAALGENWQCLLA